MSELINPHELTLDEEQMEKLRDKAYREQLINEQAFTRDQLQMVAEQLENDLNLDPVTRVSYDDFVRNGLPILQTVHETFNQAAWIQYVGQQYVRLEVYDRDGQLKYTVPSLYRQLDTPAGTLEDRYTDHTNELLSIRMDSPQVAARYQFNVLSRTVGNNIDEEIKDGVAALNAINAIFRDHGIRTLTLEDLGADPKGPVDAEFADKALEEPAIIVADENNDFTENLDPL